VHKLLLLLALAACGYGTANPHPHQYPPPVANQAPPPPPPQRLDIDSQDILLRQTYADPVDVKHVLIAWKDLAKTYAGRLDERAAKRTHEDAARLAEQTAAKLRANPAAIDALMDEIGEDPGMQKHQPYTVKLDTPFVPEFKQLAMRLALGEVGIVTTRFGYHVMIRIAPPPPDPLESADILARKVNISSVEVQHILIGWEGLDPTRDATGKQRSKAEADKLASEVLAKVRAGGDMNALMKQYSEDSTSADSGKRFTIEHNTPIFDSFKNLALRLDVNEAGLAKTLLGWHIIKRVPPPPPDPLESVAIMNRTTVAERVKVKHILLGWKDLHSEDPRGAKRTRPELEKLVKATVKKLSKKGADFEAAMKDLSEDPGSAQSGEAYEATPETGLVKPFLNMSLRLQLDEIGVVKTEFGIHIIKRVE